MHTNSILVVDDEENNRNLLARRLEREGYLVSVADSGKAALDLLEIEKFDVILLDIMMPEVDGYEVLMTLRTGDFAQDAVIIMISALGDELSVSKCLRLGANGYILKPFKMPLVKARIWENLMANRYFKERPINKLMDSAKILIVDDNELNRDLLVSRMQKAGHQTTCAENGSQALEILEKEHCDLVLLDIMMPVMDGEETLQQIRANNKWKNLPIIMISAINDPDRIDKCIENGADDFITKPFKAALLNASLESCLQGKRQHL